MYVIAKQTFIQLVKIPFPGRLKPAATDPEKGSQAGTLRFSMRLRWRASACHFHFSGNNGMGPQEVKIRRARWKYLNILLFSGIILID